MPQKDLKNYFAETEKSYSFKIKLAVNEVTEAMLDLIESAFVKYDMFEASTFRSTPIQEHPLDFGSGVANTRIYISDVAMRYPATADLVRIMLAVALGLSTDRVIVYTDNDPRQTETDLFNTRNDPKYKETYTAVLGDDDYSDEELPADNISQQGANLLATLAKVISDKEVPADVQADYDSFNSKENLPNSSPGLFGRVKVVPGYKMAERK